MAEATFLDDDFLRQLMSAGLARGAERKAPGVRLLQSAFHNRSLVLYTKLGFDTRETISKIYGPPLGLKFGGYDPFLVGAGQPRITGGRDQFRSVI